MKQGLAVLPAVLLVVALAGPTCEGPGGSPGNVVAIVGATVVPMDAEMARPEETVIVTDDRISWVGPAARAVIPPGARRIEGGGRFLMPGLADMHVHLSSEEELSSYLAAGVTTVRNMAGRPEHVAWRARLAAGELVGPTLFTGGPFVDGDPPYWRDARVVRDARDAERTVDEHLAAGYDFIKVYSLLQPPAFEALAGAARRRGLPLAGHVPAFVGLEGALAQGLRSAEHLYGYADAIEADSSPVRGRWTWRRLFGAVPIDRTRLPWLAERLRESGTWTCPTLALFDAWRPPEARADWDDPALRALGYENRRAIVAALAAGGAPLIFGTDTAAFHGMEPRRALPDELQALVAAGLTPFQALRTATADAGRFMGGTSPRFGTVQPGQQADLLLLERNPLSDVANVALVAGVMVRGRWLEGRGRSASSRAASQ